MENSTLTPEESLLLISKTIEETKQRFKENGHIIILWGVIIFAVFASQYIFSVIGWYKKFDIIWTTALFPLAAIYTFIYIRKNINKRNLPKTFLTRVIGTLGWTMGANFMALGLFFSNQLGDAMAPVFIILLAFSMIVTGASIKFKPLFIGGILLNLIGLGTFFISKDYHGFSLMLGSVVGLIVPGILLNKANKRENV
ncbi:MAG TPA: hypothetical protein PK335_08060 [Draconibacterium sp.]|nr:hypothetical protein [Draconibacterium sp.]